MKGVITPGSTLSMGREVLAEGAEVTPESLGISQAEFERLGKSGSVKIEKPKRQPRQEEESE
jgi:hypothetical protein